MSNASSFNDSNTGNLGDTRVHDILSGLEKSAQDARVWFETEYGMGEVLFQNGKIVKARLGGARGQTALLRLLAVNDGKYGIESCSVAAGVAIVPDVQSLAELHSSRKAEWNELCSNAPPLSSVLRLTASGADVRDSSRGIQRVILVLIDGRRNLMQVLEESSFEPVETLKVVTKAIDDGLVQQAAQLSTLFPLATAGDASGILPRFATPAPLPRLDPTSPGPTGGSASWRHATLVGLGTHRSVTAESARSLSPSPIIDLGHGSPASAKSGAPEVSSLVKTVIHGFGLGRRASSARALAAATTKSIESNPAIQARVANAGALPRTDIEDAPRPIVDVTASPSIEVDKGSNDEPGQALEEVPTGAASPQDDGQKRYIDRYEILLRIGRGGMGTVYLCRLSSANVGFRRLFALKLLRSHLSSDTQAAKDFLEEARVAGHLHHSNVVAVYDAGFHRKQPYLVMDYVEGCSFKELMRSLPSRSPYLLLPIVIDALRGLHAAHRLQDETGNDLRLVHCDVSPENMLVGVDGTCRLTDFGVARKADRALGATTRGKPGYVSPEQIAGQSLDHRADIFSMGVVLWAALTGKRLFTGETVEEILQQVCNKPIPPPSTLGAQSTPTLDAIILRALSRDPKGRFDSAEEMLTALSQAAISQDGLATSKEIASWVREAAGTELTQRRLAILDASRSTPTIPPPAGATEEMGPDESGGPESTHVVLTREILPPLDHQGVALRAIPIDDSTSKYQRHASNAEEQNKATSPRPAQAGMFFETDVNSLFYGAESGTSKIPRSISPKSFPAVTQPTQIKQTRMPKARKQLIVLALLVLIVGVGVVFLVHARAHGSKSSSDGAHDPNVTAADR